MSYSKNCNHFFMTGLSPNAGAALASAIALVLSEGLDTAEINTLGLFITSVGDIMGYIAAQKDLNSEALSAAGNQGDHSGNQSSGDGGDRGSCQDSDKVSGGNKESDQDSNQASGRNKSSSRNAGISSESVGKQKQ